MQAVQLISCILEFTVTSYVNFWSAAFYVDRHTDTHTHRHIHTRTPTDAAKAIPASWAASYCVHYVGSTEHCSTAPRRTGCPRSRFQHPRGRRQVWQTGRFRGTRFGVRRSSLSDECRFISTLRWAVLTVLWIVFCFTGPISLCIDSFVFMFVFVCLSCHTAYVLHYCNTVRWTWWDWTHFHIF